jgi:uncharacterized protein (DUF342 family)
MSGDDDAIVYKGEEPVTRKPYPVMVNDKLNDIKEKVENHEGRVRNCELQLHAHHNAIEEVNDVAAKRLRDLEEKVENRLAELEESLKRVCYQLNGTPTQAPQK